MFWVLKRTVLAQKNGSFEYPQHMFWLRNKKKAFLVRTLKVKSWYSRSYIFTLTTEIEVEKYLIHVYKYWYDIFPL